MLWLQPHAAQVHRVDETGVGEDVVPHASPGLVGAMSLVPASGADAAALCMQPPY